VDVLSYIRLFAVGLSSFYIAKSFNDMGAMVLGLHPWLFPAAAIVILFGHLLNIALGFMGVLVHGIRLNTLEFSNHMELTWSGKPYKPLRKAESN
jgi:V/A-type H+-transporting ATPase subunit I